MDGRTDRQRDGRGPTLRRDAASREARNNQLISTFYSGLK